MSGADMTHFFIAFVRDVLDTKKKEEAKCFKIIRLHFVWSLLDLRSCWSEQRKSLILMCGATPSTLLKSLLSIQSVLPDLLKYIFAQQGCSSKGL